MNLLLDTHVLLWWLADDPALGSAARVAIASADNAVYVSAVTAWEIVVKRRLGKLEIPADWERAIEDGSFQRLPVTWEHALQVGELPEIHRDPFDRLLVAQARVENLVLVTHDELLGQYPITILQA